MSTPPARYDNRLLRLNVGFLLKETAGYTREFNFDRMEPIRVEDIVIGHLRGALRLTRTRQGIVVQGTLHTRTAVDCTRCLTSFNLLFEVEISDLFVYPPPPSLDPPNLNVVDEGGFIDLAPLVREEGILAIPMQALCRPECKGLCSQCGQNLNEKTCDCIKEEIDPRLEGLRALLKE